MKNVFTVTYVIGVWMIDKNTFRYKKPIFVSSIKGEHIRLKNANLIVEDKDRNIIGQVSCYNIMIVFVIGDISVTTAMIRSAKKYGFTISFINSMYRTEALIGNMREGQVVLRKRQYEYEGDELANWIVRNKIKNQIITATKVDRESIFYEKIEDMKQRLEEIKDTVFELDSLRGIEGTIAAIYFRILFINENWKGRKPRQRKDFINASMDIGYTMLFNFLETIIRYYGFDIYKGFYHTDYWTRKSLICDLIEPFRVIIDEKIVKCIRQRRIVPSDFYIKNGSLQLKQKKWPEYQMMFADAILERKEDIFNYIKNFYRKFSTGAAYNEYPIFEV